LRGIFKEDFVLTKYPRLTTPGNKSSHWAECLCQAQQGKYPALPPLRFPRRATTASRTAGHAACWGSRLLLHQREPGLQSKQQSQGKETKWGQVTVNCHPNQQTC